MADSTPNQASGQNQAAVQQGATGAPPAARPSVPATPATPSVPRQTAPASAPPAGRTAPASATPLNAPNPPQPQQAIPSTAPATPSEKMPPMGSPAYPVPATVASGGSNRVVPEDSPERQKMQVAEEENRHAAQFRQTAQNPGQMVQLPPTVPYNPPPTKTYRLRENAKFHLHEGRRVMPGETVELSASQYDNFRDKFEPVDKESR